MYLLYLCIYWLCTPETSSISSGFSGVHLYREIKYLSIIIRTNAGILLIGPLGTNFSEILTEFNAFLFKKMHLKISSGECRPFYLGLNVLMMNIFMNISSEFNQFNTKGFIKGSSYSEYVNGVTSYHNIGEAIQVFITKVKRINLSSVLKLMRQLSFVSTIIWFLQVGPVLKIWLNPTGSKQYT